MKPVEYLRSKNEKMNESWFIEVRGGNSGISTTFSHVSSSIFFPSLILN